MVPTRLLLARLLNLLAIACLLVFWLFDWWLLAAAGLLALTGNLIMPRPATHGHQRRVRQILLAIQRRLNPHSWRPRRP